MRLQIRRASNDDVSALQAFQREGWYEDYADYIPKGYADYAIQIYGTAESLIQQIATSAYYFVAQVDDQVVGCITADKLKNGEVEIWWIHVARSHRGHGIGRRLMEHVIALLPEDMPAVYVTTFKNYTPTLAFYKRLGFVPHSYHVYEVAGFKLDDVRLRLDIRRG